jgi:hypothetical protein
VIRHPGIVDQHINAFGFHPLSKSIDMIRIANLKLVELNIARESAQCTGVRRGTRRGMHPPTGSGILTNQLESNAPAGPNNHRGWHV